MNQFKRIKDHVVESVRTKPTDPNLQDESGHIWSNEDLDPVAPERRNWTAFNFAAYWLSESWGTSTWSVGSSMVAAGLLWWHAFLAMLVGHLLGALLTTWNGRGGSMYHIGFPVFIRATFGPWGGMIPVFIRAILDLMWEGIQSYFGGQFLDIVFQCVFGHHWTNIPNHLPASADTTTRAMTAYFIYWMIQFTTCFFRPHQIRWLFTLKAITMPMACGGLFIWAVVRAKGPGGFELTSINDSPALLGWTFMSAINAAINGEFGPLIASEPDITRYSRRPRDQIIGTLTIAPWSATLVALLGIVAAACTQKIYGTAFWNPPQILTQILAEDDSSKTKFAVFCCAIIFVNGQIGTNFVANMVPFGVDATSLAPKYINIVRAHILCAVIGGWVMVPWKLLVSAAVFIKFVTGLGIFMGTLVGIMLADYFFIRKGNYFVEDLYTSNPNGRYWYYKGFHWRGYVAYICGIALSFPGLLGQMGVKNVSAPLNAATQIYDIGYLTSFVTSMAIYTVICKISPPDNVAEARTMPFEHIAGKEVLTLVGQSVSRSDSTEEVEEARTDVEFKKDT